MRAGRARAAVMSPVEAHSPGVPEVLKDCIRVLRWVTAESFAHRRHVAAGTEFTRTDSGLRKRVARPRSVPGVIGERGARAELRLVRVAADLQQANDPISVWP